MLILRRFAAAVLACAVALTAAASARAQDAEKDGLRRPERLTVGVADQFLGQLTPDGQTLYFLSNRNTTNEVYRQVGEDGVSEIVFDEDAEVTWPRLSPDGKSLLYVSYADRATGQLCVRDIPSADRRRCLEDPAAALLAEWIDDKRLVLVARASIEGNLRVLEVTVGSRLSSRTLFERNVTSPTVSPDGRYLVYVPLERSSRRVGPAFAAHAARHLEAVRLDQPGAPVKIALDVPGLTGQPAFSKDGKHLYFVQFFSDSNHDGVVDASDHGVLFRAPLSFSSGISVAGPIEQITDESWNCQYPSPAADRLLMTCSRGRNLDLYSLPLDGEVPSNWTAERLGAEVDLATSHARLQLLYYARLTRSQKVTTRRYLTLRLARLHVALEEFEAAEFYAKRIADLDDETTGDLSVPLLVLIDHKRAVRERERGRIVEAFEERARARMDRLKVAPGDTTAGAALSRIVRSEIQGTIGDMTLARKELEATPIAEKTPRSVIEAYYERADALYRALDDRDALVATCRRLASHPNLDDDDRLRYARAAVRAMIRGLPYQEAEVVLAKERSAAGAGSEMEFAVDLARVLLSIRDGRPAPAVHASLVALFDAQRRPDRRRALVADALDRASQYGAETITEALAERYVAAVESPEEKRRAARLYSQVMIGRAFRERDAGELTKARADFESATKHTESLEAIVGAIDLRLRAGETPEAIRAEYEAKKTESTEDVADFVKAYLISRQLSELEGDDHAKAAEEATAALLASWSELKKQCMAQALYGAVLHEQYLRTGDLGFAERAGTHYLVALELVGRNARYKAMVLGQLGVLHTQVGNYRIALTYLSERDRLPYADNSASLAVRLAMARALLHVGKEEEAAKEADEALAMIDDEPKLARYRLLALDRAALYNLAASRFSRALALYDAELAALDADKSQAARRNRFVVRLARVAAALGAEQPARAIKDLDEVDRTLADETFASSLSWPHSTQGQVARSYRIVAAGLRARALSKLGDLTGASRALTKRRDLLAEANKEADRPEYARLLMLVEAQLADNASDRKDEKAAAAAIAKALEHADTVRDRGKGAIDKEQLDVLLLAAQLSTSGGEPKPADVAKRLATANDALIAQRLQGSRSFRTYQRWLEIYLTLTGPIVKTD